MRSQSLAGMPWMCLALVTSSQCIYGVCVCVCVLNNVCKCVPVCTYVPRPFLPEFCLTAVEELLFSLSEESLGRRLCLYITCGVCVCVMHVCVVCFCIITYMYLLSEEQNYLKVKQNKYTHAHTHAHTRTNTSTALQQLASRRYWVGLAQ